MTGIEDEKQQHKQHHEHHHSGLHSSNVAHSKTVIHAREELLEEKNKHKNMIQSSLYDSTTRDEIDILDDNVSLQELEIHAVDKSEETTETIKNCLRVAEDMKEEATKTIVQLHEQGEQIRRTHQTAVVLDQELSKGEKLLSSLGGLFSKPWRPRKTHDIAGPVDMHDDHHAELSKPHDNKSRASLIGTNLRRNEAPSATNSSSQFQVHVEKEKVKQEEALSDLSNILDQLKDMSVDMGTEIQRQNDGLGKLYEDVSELECRVKGANERGRRLLN